MCVTLSRVERTASKPHFCIWCGEPIGVGERHIDHRGVNDDAGCVDTQRWHPECEVDMLRAGRAVA